MKTIKVTDITSKIRIDKYLSQILESSRKDIEKYFIQNKITVNNKVIKKNYSVKNNDVIVLEELEIETINFEGNTNIKFEVIFENDNYIIVNKPRGLVVHPAPGHYNDTLVNGLVSKFNSLSDINGEERPGIVHRIDKDTSGLLVVAKNNQTHKLLSEQLSNNKPKREYYAIVEGLVTNNMGTINAPIGRDVKNRKKYRVTAQNSKHAVTHFEVIKRFESKTLIKCVLETGRTHQIRVHMEYIAHPIIGDELYNNKTQRKELFKQGQALHAKTLGFIDPYTNENVEFDSHLDDYISNIIKSLEEESNEKA